MCFRGHFRERWQSPCQIVDHTQGRPISSTSRRITIRRVDHAEAFAYRFLRHAVQMHRRLVIGCGDRGTVQTMALSSLVRAASSPPEPASALRQHFDRHQPFDMARTWLNAYFSPERISWRPACGGSVAGQLAQQPLCQHRQPGQFLPDAVMQFLPDALLGAAISRISRCRVLRS